MKKGRTERGSEKKIIVREIIFYYMYIIRLQNCTTGCGAPMAVSGGECWNGSDSREIMGGYGGGGASCGRNAGGGGGWLGGRPGEGGTHFVNFKLLDSPPILIQVLQKLYCLSFLASS